MTTYGTLIYIVIPVEESPTIAEDPIVTGDAPYSTSYTSFFDKVIRCSKLSGASYNENNSRVFAFLSQTLNEFIPAQTLRPFSRRRDGILSFQVLVKQNLGSSKWEEE